MPHLDLSTSSQSTAGLSSRRAFCLTGSAGAAVQIESLASSVATSGPVLRDPRTRAPVVLLNGDRIVVEDPSAFLRYRVISGTVTACYVDADADPAVGPQGAGSAVHWDKSAADGSAGATLSHYLYRADTARTITAVRIIPDGTLTAHATNYATISIAVEDGAAGAVGTAASQTTKTTGAGGSGDWAAGVPVDITLGATVALSAGQVLKGSIAKAASGVVVPAFTLQVDFA